MRRFFTAFILVTGILVLSGCENRVTASALAGTSWRLSSWSAASPDPSRYTITASFTDSAMSGRSAVNSYSGSYTAETDGAFSVGILESTLMASPDDDAMSAESTYLDLLGRAIRYALTDTTLTLYDGNGSVLLVFSRQ
jgi:heat shock protein HslJ